MKVFLAELRMFGSRIGGTRSILLHLGLLVAFGFGLPRTKGVGFLDSEVLSPYACLGLIFAGPATAQCFVESFTPSLSRARARVFVGVLYGEAIALTLMAGGIATIFFRSRWSYITTLDWLAIARFVALGCSACAAISSMAAWVTVTFSRSIALLCLRLMYFGLLLLFFYKGQRLPEVVLSGVSISTIATIIFMQLLRRACPRS